MSEFKSYAAIAAARDSTWTATQRLVFTMLAFRADATGECWASAQTIGDDCGLSERAVRIAFQDLSACKAIIGRKAEGKSTVWRFDLEAVPRRPVPPPTPEPRSGDPGTSFTPERRSPRNVVPGTPEPGSDPPRNVVPGTPEPGSDDPSKIRPDIRPRSVHSAGEAECMNGAAQVQCAQSCQQSRSENQHDVPRELTAKDIASVRRWADGHEPADFELVWAYFGSSNDFEPASARQKGHFRWSTLCNDRFEVRLQAAHEWEARGRRDAAPEPRRSRSRSADPLASSYRPNDGPRDTLSDAEIEAAQREALEGLQAQGAR